MEAFVESESIARDWYFCLVPMQVIITSKIDLNFHLVAKGLAWVMKYDVA